MPEETKSLVRVDNFMALQKADQIREVIKVNFGEQGISLFNLERIRIPAGGATSWTIADPTGEESSIPEIVAMIPHKKGERNYWKQGFNESGGGTPPSCHSDDLIKGYGDNGEGEGEHVCRVCPRNQWKQGENSASSKDCREMRILFVLRQGREEHIFPSILVITPGSLKALDGYLTSLTSRAIPYFACLHKLTLEKVRSKGGITYASIRPKMLRELKAEELTLVTKYHHALSSAFGGLTITSEEAQAT
jgi:hypothetical protein